MSRFLAVVFLSGMLALAGCSGAPVPVPGGRASTQANRTYVDPCSQPQRKNATSAIALSSFAQLTQAIEGAHLICFSAYVFTSDSFNMLQNALAHGANVTIVLPQEEAYDDMQQANELQRAGASIVWDDGTSTHPLHAKLAVADGVAYLDGRNWDSGDVVISDGIHEDFTAIEKALNLQARKTLDLDTLKAWALGREVSLINGALGARKTTVRFMSESFGSNAAVDASLERAAKSGADVRIVVLGSYVPGNQTEISALNALKAAGARIRLNPASGSEKMALVAGSSVAWFGSANATESQSEGSNYIDWGATISTPLVVRVLQTYFDQTWANSSPY